MDANRLEQLAARTAEAVHRGFDEARARFNEITAAARERFESAAWPAMMADMSKRLEMHSSAVDDLIRRVRADLGELAIRTDLWVATKRAFSARVAHAPSRELAETFFSSVSRRMLNIVGKSVDTEFDSDETIVDPRDENPAAFARYPWTGATDRVVRQVLVDRGFRCGFEDLDGDTSGVAREIDTYVHEILGTPTLDALEILHPVFFRQKLAFVVGRIRAGNNVLPIVLSLRRGDRGISVDAVLMRQSEVSVIFSFTRSHFHVETDCPKDLVVFLKGIMPLKPVAELYISLGFFKHGKTELYRSLRSHLQTTIDRFRLALGKPGMVMIVFTLPFHNVVFKVIRDKFAPPKNNTRADVLEGYQLVFTRDRVGRLVEAQEFEHLELRSDLFEPSVLEELLREASSTVFLRDGSVVLRHVYVERKVAPLDVYLQEATETEAEDAIRDYGLAVKELASADIFPGDFLLKNFGVTRNGRVVFYDYDELCLMSECRFRAIPPARHDEDEMSAEPWFSVGENDVFPEEFERFLSLSGRLRDAFRRDHSDLFEPSFWQKTQDRLAAGEIMDVYPYPDHCRLRRG